MCVSARSTRIDTVDRDSRNCKPNCARLRRSLSSCLQTRSDNEMSVTTVLLACNSDKEQVTCHVSRGASQSTDTSKLANQRFQLSVDAVAVWRTAQVSRPAHELQVRHVCNARALGACQHTHTMVTRCLRVLQVSATACVCMAEVARQCRAENTADACREEAAAAASAGAHSAAEERTSTAR